MKLSDAIQNDGVIDGDDEVQLINLAYAPPCQVAIGVQVPIEYVKDPACLKLADDCRETRQMLYDEINHNTG